MRKASRWLWLILAFGLLVRLAVFIAAQPWTEQGEARQLAGSGDILSYHYLAHDLVLYGRYGGHPEADPYNLDPVIRPMGYALFIALWYWLFEPKLWYPLLAQVILSVASIALLYSVARREFGERAALSAALLFAMYPNGSLFASTLMTETIYIFVVLLFLEVWTRFKVRAVHTPRTIIIYGSLLGFLLGLSVYVRVATLYFALLVPLAFWFLHNTLSKPMRVRLVASLVGAFIVSILPYSLYMYQRYGTFRLTIVESFNILDNTVGHALGGRQGRIDPEAAAFKKQLWSELMARMVADGVDPVHADPFLKGSYFRQLAWEYIRRYPMEVAWGMVQGMVRFWLLPDRVGEIANEVLAEGTPARRLLVGIAAAGALIYHLAWLFLLGVGVVCAWRFHKGWFWLFLVAALYFTLAINAAGNDRYRMQGAAFAFPLAGLGCSRVMSLRRHRATHEV